jgi:hypothetical protein
MRAGQPTAVATACGHASIWSKLLTASRNRTGSSPGPKLRTPALPPGPVIQYRLRRDQPRRTACRGSTRRACTTYVCHSHIRETSGHVAHQQLRSLTTRSYNSEAPTISGGAAKALTGETTKVPRYSVYVKMACRIRPRRAPVTRITARIVRDFWNGVTPVSRLTRTCASLRRRRKQGSAPPQTKGPLQSTKNSSPASTSVLTGFVGSNSQRCKQRSDRRLRTRCCSAHERSIDRSYDRRR